MEGIVEGPDCTPFDRVSSILLFPLLPEVPGRFTDEVRGGGVGGGLFRIDFLRTGLPRELFLLSSVSWTRGSCGAGGCGVGSLGSLDLGGFGMGTVLNFFSGVRIP